MDIENSNEQTPNEEIERDLKDLRETCSEMKRKADEMINNFKTINK